ncbi:hypothetical protein DPEC_G00237470 [Dallia pectoralis]|uniref:Uncharacterized protein n=1 Tax=Dallia pectoralis TaxID=75939 RepID=A0ACC2FYN7_DALPE|nr:hypothetical protein DPEC_G00237470 [Dallia pectoralis]
MKRVFLGAVDAGKEPWTVQLKVREKEVRFKIDTGADVTALPADVYYDITGGPDVTRLARSTRPLFGPGGNVLSVLGVARETLRRGKKTATEDIYVVKDLHTALLGRPAIEQLQLVSRAVQEMDAPKNVSELRSFLGMVNQLGRFLPNVAEKDKVLRDLLSKKNHWYWGTEQQAAFDQLKADLSSTPVLALYNPNSALKISADASSFGLGAVLLQKSDARWSPVAYASRSMTPTEQRYAQVEKEALAATWACERFGCFILGRPFELETDHKPLVSLLGGKALDDLPPRIQRFKMRLMRYNYSVSHVPGKSLWTADTLSRAPLRTARTHTDTSLLEDTNIYVDSVISNIPVSGDYLSSLREHLKADSTCSALMEYCTDGWPDKSQLQGALRHYRPDRAVLTVHDGLLLRGTRLVIPFSLQGDVLQRLHEGHLGVTKCRGRAKQTVWWPGLSSQLNDMVLKCRTCIQERRNVNEPLMPTEMPDRPWQTLGADLFALKGKTYLLVVDFFSRYVEIALLSPTRSTDVVVHLKSIFSRHGICEFLKSDNGPQFSGSHFKAFAAEYGFVHITSSPKFPQSNGEAERAVQTVKNLLTKASDPYLALLAYRATPLQNGYSPAELLMGGRLRTTVPALPTLLDPVLPDYNVLEAKEKRANDAEIYNKRHGARNLEPLVPGEDVWITDARVLGTVLAAHNTPRSYIVQGPQGTLRRNRHHLVPLQTNSGVIDADEPRVHEESLTEHFQRDADADSVSQDLAVQQMKIFNIKTTTPEGPDDIGVIVEGVKVLTDLGDFARACCMVIGVAYAANLAYPKELRHTMEVFQKLFLELDSSNLSPKVNSLKNKLLA